LNQVVNEWNSLPDFIVNDNSLDSFKIITFIMFDLHAVGQDSQDVPFS